MTPSQRLAVQKAFIWADNAFKRNHAVCRSRGECLNFDLRSLTSYIHTYPNHPATPLFANIFNMIRFDSQHQKFVSEWVIFQKLSPARQSEYRSGIRVTPIQPQYVRAAWGATWISKPGFFNLDDVLTYLIQEIDHRHKNCNQYLNCLNGDLQYLTYLSNRLALGDPARNTLSRLRVDINTLANHKMFNTSLYLALYNPLNPAWNDVLRKHKAKKLAGYGYSEWRKIERSSRALRWQAPRFTNGASIQQNYNNNQKRWR